MLSTPIEDTTNVYLDDFFDQEFYDLTAEDKLDRLPDDGARIELHHVEGDLGPHKVYENCDKYAPQPWREGLWCLRQQNTPNLHISKVRKGGAPTDIFVSPTNLVKQNIHDVGVRSSEGHTKQVCPLSQQSASSRAQPRHTILREHTLSPSPMYAMLPETVNSDHCQWEQDFQNFNICMGDGQSESMLGATKAQPVKRDAHVRETNERLISHHRIIGRPGQSPTRYHYPFQHVHRPQSQLQEGNDCRLRDCGQEQQYEHLPTPAWTTESLPSSDSSHFSQNSHLSRESYTQQTLSAIPGTLWFPEHVTNSGNKSPRKHGHKVGPMTQLIQPPSSYQQVSSAQHDLHTRQISISEIGRAVPYGEPDTDAAPAVTSSYMSHSNTTQPADDFPYVLPPTGPMGDVSQFTGHRSRSTSPSVSPTSHSRQSLRQRSPSRPEHGRIRRKSIHKPGPIKTVDTRRARSISRPPRTPKSPRTPKKGLQLDFVNFTPEDSIKLMNDVAPSGSSKTRARREQEAREKRKRLSEAALQAVMIAGGDVSALEDAFVV